MVQGVQEIDAYFTTAPGRSVKIGALLRQDNRLFFEYSTDWLNRGIELSPFTLPLRPGIQEHKNREFGPLFGLFDDSLPDGWGLLLMDRFFRKTGLDPVSISPLQRLAYLGSETMGALTYQPPANRPPSEPSLVNLHELSQHAHDIFAGEPIDVLPQLLRAGGSPGGARPKVLVGFNPTTSVMISGTTDLPPGYEHWLVKFSSRVDVRDAGPVEYAYSLMAKAAGIVMPETRLFETGTGDRFFAAKRFDRAEGNCRRHIHTFGNMIETDFRLPNCDYADLLKVTTLLTRNHEELLRVIRLLVFNVLAHNRDDHAKNFSFILDDKTCQWNFAPAYDLVFSSGPGGEHTTTVAGEGRSPTREHISKLASQFDIKQRLVNTIIDEVTDAIGRWQDFAGEAGLSPEARDTIARQIQG